jgi:hypothetical protein
MSIYSGFCTRKQEHTYNRFVFKVLEILSYEILNIKKNKFGRFHFLLILLKLIIRNFYQQIMKRKKILFLINMLLNYTKQSL